MEPVPESQVVAALLGAAAGTDLLGDLRCKADRARLVVPELLGASISWTASDLTLTVVASPEDFAVLDALQYLGGGPALDAVLDDRTVERDDLVLDEERWSLFARGAAAAGIASSLSFPLRDDDQVVGGINLYAGSRRAFSGAHDQLAGIFGGWAGEVVSDADLGFRTREEAAASSRRLAQRIIVDHAVDVVARQRGLAPDEARVQLVRAAHRAGVELIELALSVIDHWG